MRSSVFAMAAGLSLLAAGAFSASRAEAMTLPAPAGLSAATAAASAVGQVRLHCHSWQDGRRWHKRCWNAPDWWNPGWGWAPGQVTTLNPQPLPPQATLNPQPLPPQSTVNPQPLPPQFAGPGAAGAGGKKYAHRKVAKAPKAPKSPGAPGGGTKY